MNKTDAAQTARTLTRLRNRLDVAGFSQTAVDRHERGDLAVETGYVYGEITTKIWMQQDGRNLGQPLQTIRGDGLGYVEDVLEAVETWDSAQP